MWSKTSNGVTQNTHAIQVISPESISGDPRENERAYPNSASFNGTLNESFTPARQLEIISNALGTINGYSDLIKQSDRGSLDFKPIFTAGELIDLNGIYMNNHEALNYMWEEAMAEINCTGKVLGGLTIDQALSGAAMFNEWDYIFGHTETWENQPNHDEAIVRGYLNSSKGTATGIARDTQVKTILMMFNVGSSPIVN